MESSQGLILRVVPYSDKARIIRCFTLDKGAISLFSRISKKAGHGHLRLGSFIEFKAKSKSSSSMPTLQESRWLADVPSDPLAGEALAVWMFTIEVLQRSLKDEIAFSKLYRQLMTYYAYLTQSSISLDPIIPLIISSSALGLCDHEVVAQLDDQQQLEMLREKFKIDLPQAGLQLQRLPRNAVFNIELERFQRHFSIDRLESLVLLGE